MIYRVDESDKYSYESGVEYQLLDDDSFSDRVKAKQLTGSIYQLYAPVGAKPNPVKEWNSARIVVEGNHIEHWLNGVWIVEAEIGSAYWKQKIKKSKFEQTEGFASLKLGHICFQGHTAGAWFRNIRIKDLSSENTSIDSKPEPPPASQQMRVEGEVFRLAVSKDGKKIASCGNRSGVALWDLHSKEQLWTTEIEFKEKDNAVEFEPSDKFLWVCGTKETVKLDVNNGTKLKTYPIRGTRSVFSSDFRYLFVDGKKGALNAFELPSGRKLNSQPNIWATNLDVSNDSGFLLIGGYGNNELRLASIADTKIVRKFPKESARTRGVFSNDKRFVAQWTGPHEKQVAMRHNVKIFETKTGRKVSELTAFKGWQYRVAFSPDNRTLATVGSGSLKSWQGANRDADNSVRVWDVKTGKLRQTFGGHRTAVYDAIFTPDGKKLITAGHSGLIRIWDLK